MEKITYADFYRFVRIVPQSHIQNNALPVTLCLLDPTDSILKKKLFMNISITDGCCR